LTAGRSFWMHGTSTLHLPGVMTPWNKIFVMTYPGQNYYFNQWVLQVPNLAADHVGDYMLGNPFGFGFVYGNIWIEQPMFNDVPLGKVAADDLYNDLLGIKYWGMDFTLSDLAGTHSDAGNVAGVLESGKDLHTLYNAADYIAPLPEYISMAFRDPENSGSKLTWDYRAPGLDKYEWTFDLTTNVSSIATKLSQQFQCHPRVVCRHPDRHPNGDGISSYRERFL